jgi:DNA-binding MarR family transcriptional regulator
MEPHFASFGISGSQWAILHTLHRAEEEGLPEVRLTDISNRLLIRPPSVTGAVQRLRRMRLVTGGASQTDQRAKSINLTSTGRQLVERVFERHGEQIRSVLGCLTEREQAQLARLLARLGSHLGEMIEEGPAAAAAATGSPNGDHDVGSTGASARRTKT